MTSEDANTTWEGLGYKSLSGKIETERDAFTNCGHRKGRLSNYPAPCMPAAPAGGKLFTFMNLVQTLGISSSMLFFFFYSVKKGLGLKLFSDLCFLSISYVPIGRTSNSLTISHQWRRKSMASFPSLCYFQMQPTERGTRGKVGNSTFSRVTGNNLEAQIPNLTKKSSRVTLIALDLYNSPSLRFITLLLHMELCGIQNWCKQICYDWSKLEMT